MHAFFKFRYNIECDSKSITKCEQRHSELISCKNNFYFKQHMFIQRKQAEWFEDEKEKETGRKVVVQVDFIKNYIELVSLEPVTSYSVLRVCIYW